jgi:hypothetical protein
MVLHLGEQPRGKISADNLDVVVAEQQDVAATLVRTSVIALAK